jgi:hypothetical protein
VALIAIAVLIWFFYIGFDYVANLSRHPDPAAGRVYPLNEHYVTVYQTRDQRDRFDEIKYSVFGMLATTFILKAIRVNTFGRGTKP